MNNILMVSGHPDLASSLANKYITDQFQSAFEASTFRQLDILYPDYKIAVEDEQNALSDADIIVLQFPFYWYSMPALLKKWLDDVFSFGFAYGSSGNKLKGKKLTLSFTIGGPEESYHPLGYNHFSIAQLLHPLEQTAFLSQLDLQKPVYSHGMVYIPEVYNTEEAVLANAKLHADQLIKQVTLLLNEHSDIKNVA